jgi:hypothetical protein
MITQPILSLFVVVMRVTALIIRNILVRFLMNITGRNQSLIWGLMAGAIPNMLEMLLTARVPNPLAIVIIVV